MRLNIGCGATPTDGWANMDNSFTILGRPSGIREGILWRFVITQTDCPATTSSFKSWPSGRSR